MIAQGPIGAQIVQDVGIRKARCEAPRACVTRE